jgi:hypothetical protein
VTPLEALRASTPDPLVAALAALALGVDLTEAEFAAVLSALWLSPSQDEARAMLASGRVRDPHPWRVLRDANGGTP